MKISVSLHNAPKKGEDQNLRQVIFRVREGNNDLKVRTDLMADPKLWDESIPGYRRTTKLGKGGTKAFNDRLQDIFRLIEADFTPMRDGKWLKETINGYLHPVAEQPKPFSPLPCEDNEKDTSLENLDKGTVHDWLMKYVVHCDVSHGRKACYLSTIKKLRRYELFKREFESQKLAQSLIGYECSFNGDSNQSIKVSFLSLILICLSENREPIISFHNSYGKYYDLYI